MIDKYIILNRKPKVILILFALNISFLTGLVIIWINTVHFQSYIKIHSQISIINSRYNLKVLIPAKEVKKIINQNTIWIETKKYNYKVSRISDKITYKNKTNYITLYLDIDRLEKKYLINGYHLETKIKR